MKTKNIGLKEIREKYGREDNNFIIRIREDSRDIVYYNGNKAFELEKDERDKEELKKIVVRDNIFNFNSKNIRKVDIDKLKEKLKKSRKEIQKHTDIRILKSVTLKISENTYKTILRDKKETEDFESRMNNLQTTIREKYEQYIDADKLDIEKIKAKFENEIAKAKRNTKKKKKENVLKYKIDLKDNTEFAKENIEKYLEDTIWIEYLFIKYCIFNDDNTFKKNPRLKIPQFEKNAIENTENNSMSVAEYKSFEDEIKNAIVNYETDTKFELEKKYQHLFMISKILGNKYDAFNDMYRFEEEYYTDEGAESSDKGRIDCVFVKINEDKQNAELYLIELKVDSNVIGGSNGVNKHLIDIRKLEKNEDFINDLEKRINYRRRILKEGTKEIKIDKENIHFWTVIAISEESELENVADMLYTKLEDPAYIANEKNHLPEKSVILSEEIEKVRDKGIDVKFLFDKWEYKTNSDELSNKYLFEAKSKEELMKKWKTK